MIRRGREPADGRRSPGRLHLPARRSRPGEHRAGFSLAEVVIAGTLLLLVVQSVWTTAAVQGVAASRVIREAGIVDETRLIHHLLATEIGHGRTGADWTVGGDTLALRAFRGVAFACHDQPSAGWRVATSGLRLANADKDSVLVFTPEAGWQASRLVSRSRARASDCQNEAGFGVEVWTLDPPRPGALAASYFERGGYRFSSGAFRYRTGSRWQPLSINGIEGDSTWIRGGPAGAVTPQVSWAGDGSADDAGRAVTWTLWGAR